MSHLKIVRDYNVEAPNRGWEIDFIQLFVDDVPAGYAKIQNIPKKNLELFYPQGAYDYLRTVAGWSIEDNIEDFKNNSHVRRLDERFPDWSKKQKISYFNKLFKEKFQNFIDFHVDRPIIDYIRIYSKNEQQTYYTEPKMVTVPMTGSSFLVTERHFENRTGVDGEINPSFREKGLGNVIYLESALFLKDKGLTLHRSNTIEDAAAQRWLKIEEKYPDIITRQPRKDEPEKTDVIMDGTNLDRDFYPDWVSHVTVLDKGEVIADFEPAVSPSFKM